MFIGLHNYVFYKTADLLFTKHGACGIDGGGRVI